MMNKSQSKNVSLYKHLSIVLVCMLVLSLSLGFYYIPSVEADLPGPYYIYGYIENSTNQAIPLGVTVTVTNTNNDNSGTTTTGSGGAFSINVGKDSGFDCSNDHQIVVNCSYNSQVSENATTIDTSKSYRWCNLTGGTRLQDQNLSINVTPDSWAAGTINYGSWNTTSNTYFNFTNQGNVKINVKIHGYNVSYNGNTWKLNSSTGVNNYTLTYQKSGTGTWTAITLSNSSFISNLQFNSQYFSYTYWQEFGLNLSMPTSSSTQPSAGLSTSVRFWSEIA